MIEGHFKTECDLNYISSQIVHGIQQFDSLNICVTKLGLKHSSVFLRRDQRVSCLNAEHLCQGESLCAARGTQFAQLILTVACSKATSHLATVSLIPAGFLSLLLWLGLPSLVSSYTLGGVEQIFSPHFPELLFPHL